MKPQQITINLPKVKATINDILVAELKSTTIHARGVKDIKEGILDLENQFYTDVSNKLKDPLVYAPTKLLVRAELEGKEIVKYEVTTRAVSSTKDFSLMSGNFTRRVMKVILQALQAYTIEIILANGATLTSNVRYQLQLDNNIKIQIMLTQKELELLDKGQVSISYGGNEHLVLYEISQGTWQHLSASLITLTHLGLIEDVVPAAGNVRSTCRYMLTEEGKRVLGELDQIDPSNCPELVSYFASRLLGVSRVPSEFDYFFITGGGFCEPKGRIPYYEKITDKGRKWLEEHSSLLLKKWTLKSETRDEVKALIPYLSLRQLPIFLASEHTTIRELAQRRLEELQNNK